MNDPEDDSAEYRVPWHSDHYDDSARARPQDGFKKLWLDALTDTGRPMSVPMVVDWFMVRPDLMVGTGSWCLSYGREQSQRSMSTYYFNVWPECLTEEEKVAAVMTERLLHYSQIMAAKKQLESAGVDLLPKSKFWKEINKANNSRPPLYILGDAPLKVRKWGTKSQLEVYDPKRIDWTIRQNKLEAAIVELLNRKKITVAECRTVMVESMKVLAGSESPPMMAYVRQAQRPIQS